MFARLFREERGVTAVIIAVSLVAVFGAAVLSIDFGNMYQTRRSIVTGTDASALQEAQLASTYTTAPPGCSPTWQAAITNNSGAAASPISCSVTVTRMTASGVPILGYVQVDARKLSLSRFGRVIGVGDSSPYALSAAQWGPPSGLIGLRPFGLCDQDSHFLEWAAYAARGYPTDPQDQYNILKGSAVEHPLISGAGVVHRLYVDNGGGSCGQAPGNWAWLDYNSSSNPTGAQREWWQTGYTPLVKIHQGPHCTWEQASDGDPIDGCVPGNTGNRGVSFEDMLADLKARQAPVPIMVFSALTGEGQNSIFEATNFLSVIVRDYNVHGSTHWLDLEFVRHDWGGSCCNTDPTAVDTGARVVRLCGVDHDVSGGSPSSRCA